MHITYLILAHAHPDQLARLVKRLVTDGPSRVLIHIDAKSDIRQFSGIAGPSVTFLTNRVLVGWGEFSMVEATLALLRAGLAEPTDRLVLMSGSDYPVHRRALIENILAEAELFVTASPIISEKRLNRLNRFRPQPDQIFLRWIVKNARKRIYSKLFYRDYRRTFGSIQPYIGDQWWAMSESAANKITNFTEKQSKILNYFKNTFGADETYFQTLMHNLPYLGSRRPSVTFVRWGMDIKHPVTLTPEMVESFIREGAAMAHTADGVAYRCCFARKMPTDDGGALAAMLDDAFRDEAL